MKKRKSPPLMVVATANPAEVASISLKRFSTAEGDFITNANLKFVFSPYSGKEMASDQGVEVEDTIEEDEAVGVVCRACKTINATMDHARKELSCVACGTHLAFDADGEQIDEDDLDAEAEFDPDQFDDDEEAEVDDLTDDVSEDLDEAELDDEDTDDIDEEAEFDDAEEVDLDEVDSELDIEEAPENDAEDEQVSSDDENAVDLTDIVDVDAEDEQAKATFIKLNDSTVAAVAGNLIVAHMSSKHASFDRALSEAFADGVNKVAETYGLNEALTSAGFKTVKVKTKAAMASKMRRAQRKVESSVKREVASTTKHLHRCLDIAAAGGLVGLFKKEKASVMFDELTTVLSGLNVTKPRAVARRVLAKALRQHNAAMLETAESLMNREESVLAAFEEQIMASEDTQFDNTELEVEDPAVETTPEEQAVLSRLSNPILKTQQRASVTANDKTPRIAGLFNR